MTNQELFTRVKAHLLKQNEQALNEDGTSCLYRSPKGLSCAIGCLIPDEKYHARLEGGAADSRRIVEAAGLTHENESLAMTLQSIHDLTSPSSWPHQLEATAAQYWLENV